MVDAALDRLIAHRSRIVERAESQGATGRRIPIAESIPSRYGEVLCELVAAAGARTILEVGLGNAVSTLYLCEPVVRRGAWRAGDVVTMDPYQNDVDGVGVANVAAAGLTRLVTVYREPSQIVLPRLLDEGRRFDFAFIDGDHLFEGVFVDLYFVNRLLAPGGQVVLDDAYLPSVQWALDYFVRNRGWTLRQASFPEGALGFSVPDRCRMALVTVPAERPEREWDHFAPFGYADPGALTGA